MTFLFELCLILILTTLVGHLCQRINLPAVVGELMVGIICGPALLGWFKPDHVIETFAQVGVILLMFMAGLESDLGLLKKYLKPSLLVAILGIILPVIVIGGASILYGFDTQEGILVGVTFAATSVSISVEVLKELHILNSKEGATILGASVADDIGVVLIFSLCMSLLLPQAGTQRPLWLILLFQVAYFVGIFLMVKYLVPKLMRFSERLLMGSATTIMALVICLGMAYVAELAGLSDVVGAFFAGIAVAQTPQKKVIDEKIEPIGYGVFIPVFFVNVGLAISFAGLQKQWLFIVIMTVLAILTKLVGGGLGAKLAGFNLPSAKVVGAGMISRGEMALIVAQMGYASHLLSEKYYSALILIIILATLIAPFILKYYANQQAEKGQLKQHV